MFYATTQAVVVPECDMRKALLFWRSSEDVVYKYCQEFPQSTQRTSLRFLFTWMFHVFFFFIISFFFFIHSLV